jgi:hypothetical protein
VYLINTHPFPPRVTESVAEATPPLPAPETHEALEDGAAFATCGVITKSIDAANARAVQHRVTACKKVRVRAEFRKVLRGMPYKIGR